MFFLCLLRNTFLFAGFAAIKQIRTKLESVCEERDKS